MTRQRVLRCMRLTRASSGKGCDEAHLVRLTRNFDKQRGFVSGTVAVVCESLRGNEAFNFLRLVESRRVPRTRVAIENS
jgi:hypothetical protein